MATRNVPVPLPRWEQRLYWLTEGVTVGYMIYTLYQASDDARRKNEPILIEEGWGVSGRPMDVADFEWMFWTSYFWNLLPWVCGQVLLSCTVSWCVHSLEVKAALLAFYGFLATTYLIGVGTMAVFLTLPVTLYLVAQVGSATTVWITSLVFLTALNVSESTSALRWIYEYYSDLGYSTPVLDAWLHVSVFSWGSLYQRTTAFSLECVWARRQSQSQSLQPAPPAEEPGAQNTNNVSSGDNEPGAQTTTTSSKARSVHVPVPDPLPQVPGWLDLFHYVFYFPLFFTGPLTIYSKFYRQCHEPQPLTKTRLLEIALKLARVLFWVWMYFAILHFVYPHAITLNSEVLEQQSRMTIAAIGYSLGQMFMVKYVALYGLPAQLARLDGLEPPAVPACISYIYCYSDMWRSFDRGLYDFMKRYIFFPLRGARRGLAYRVIGSAFCFAFVFYWHGAKYYLFLWCLLNFVETSLEQVGAWLETTDLVKTRVYNKLSPAGIRRVRAAMSVPMFLMSVFAIFYFFGGTRSGLVFLRKLLTEIPWGSLAVFLALVYCSVQNAMELERLGLTKVGTTTTKRTD